MFRTLAFFFFFSFICFDVTAGNDSARFSHLTIDNGLPSNHIYSVVTDHLGCIWMATDNGVVRYNGHSFRLFTTEDGLPTNDIWRIYEDRKGRVWLFANSYRFGYIASDVYHPINFSNSGTTILPRQIAENGTAVVLWYQEHMIQKLAVIREDSVNIISITYQWNTRGLFLGPDMSVWVYKYNGDLYLFNPSEKRPRRLAYRRQPNFADSYAGQGNRLFTANGKCFISGQGFNHLDVFNFINGNFYKISVNKDDPGDRLVTQDYMGDSLVLVTAKSIYYLNGKTDSIVKGVQFPEFLISKVSSYNSALPFLDIYSTYRGGVWISSRYTLFSDVAKRRGELERAKIVGTSNRQVYFWDQDESEFFSVQQGHSRLAIKFHGLGFLRYVNSMGIDSLIMIFQKGAYSYDIKRGRLSGLFSGRDSFIMENYHLLSNQGRHEQMSDSFAHLFVANSARISALKDSSYLMLNYGGVHLISFDDNAVVCRMISADRYTGFINDPKHSLNIVYNASGLLLLNDHWQRLKINDLVERMLVRQNLINILQDNGGNYYIHGDKNLFFYDTKQNKLKNLHVNFNLSTSRSFIWRHYIIMIGDFGLAFSNQKEGSGQNTFVLLPNFKRKSYSRVSDCSVDTCGIVYVNTESSSFILRMDSLVMRKGLFAFAKDTMIHVNLKRPFSTNIHAGDTIIVSQKTGKIAFEAINYFGGEGLQYYFEGMPGEWLVSASGDFFIDEMPPGKYCDVQCYVRDAYWKSDTLKFCIYQPLYWYQTSQWKVVFWLVVALIFGISLVIASLLTKHYVARGNEKRRWQTELELRAIHSQINPHFIFNTLSTALFYISKQRSGEAYDHVSRFSKLLRGYLKSSRERLIVLADEIGMLEQYIKLQKAGFQKPFDHEVHVEQALAAHEIMIPSLLLQPIVENAINHGLFHKPEKGKLVLSFIKGKDDTELICIIDDNGIGRAQSRTIQKNLKLKRESYGTALTDDLINVIQKYEQMNIGITYIDKDFPDTGTIVRLTIGNVKKVAEQEVKR